MRTGGGGKKIRTSKRRGEGEERRGRVGLARRQGEKEAMGGREKKTEYESVVRCKTNQHKPRENKEMKEERDRSDHVIE